MTRMSAVPSLTTAQMAEVDRLMIEVYGIQLIQMMENAGRNLAELARRMLSGNISQRRILVLSGAGHNGGGGLAAARHLHNWGADVRVVLTAEKHQLKTATARQWQILRAMRVADTMPPSEAADPPELVVDAIIGYGLERDPRESVAGWIRRANAWSCPVLALDAPSGLDTTTGHAAGPCVRATATLTLALPKAGLLMPEAKPYVGDLYVADISVPPGLYRRLGIELGPLFADDTIVRLA